MPKESLSITDNRTGKQYEVPIENDTIKAMDLRQIKTSDDDFGLMTYDPAFMNTASCKSRITFIDGDKGILEYRGYPIDQLAENRTVICVAHRLSTLAKMDLIIVLSQGRIAEEGRFEDLLRGEGIFAAMARRQGIMLGTRDAAERI